MWVRTILCGGSLGRLATHRKATLRLSSSNKPTPLSHISLPSSERSLQMSCWVQFEPFAVCFRAICLAHVRTRLSTEQGQRGKSCATRESGSNKIYRAVRLTTSVPPVALRPPQVFPSFLPHLSSFSGRVLILFSCQPSPELQ